MGTQALKEVMCRLLMRKLFLFLIRLSRLSSSNTNSLNERRRIRRRGTNRSSSRKLRSYQRPTTLRQMTKLNRMQRLKLRLRRRRVLRAQLSGLLHPQHLLLRLLRSLLTLSMTSMCSTKPSQSNLGRRRRTTEGRRSPSSSLTNLRLCSRVLRRHSNSR